MSEFDITKAPKEVQRAVLLTLCQEAVVAAAQNDIDRVLDRLARSSFVASHLALIELAGETV